MPKKFIITDAWSSERVPLGGGFAFNFMEAQLALAAQKAGYETYLLLCKTINKENSTAELVEVEFCNVELLDKILSSEEDLKELIKVSNRRLEKMFSDGEIPETQRQHELKSYPISVAYLHRLCTQFKDRPASQELINFLRSFALKSAVPFDLDRGFFVKRQKVVNHESTQINLREFLRTDDKTNDNVVYIRSFVRADKDFLPWIEGLRRESGAKFPVTPESQKFHDKEVVLLDGDLKKYAAKSDIFSGDLSEIKSELVEFYKKHCRSEGMVLKPGQGGSFGGTAVVVLDSDIPDDKIAEEVEKALAAMSGDAMRRYQSSYCLGKIIAQERLHNLFADDDLAAGDIRFTIINGQLAGAALRYSNDRDVKVLSYMETKSVLPNNLSFTRKNIEALLEAAPSQREKSYYENMLKMHDAILDVVSWSEKNHHFHDGVDIILGRNKAGEWKFYLTEINNVIPDCIAETRWINARAGESSERIMVCDSMVKAISENKYLAREVVSTSPSQARAAEVSEAKAVRTT